MQIMYACYVWFDAFPHNLKVLDGYIVHCGIDYKPGLYKVNFRGTKANYIQILVAPYCLEFTLKAIY